MASVARMAKSAEVGVEEELFSKLKQIIISQGYSSGK